MIGPQGGLYNSSSWITVNENSTAVFTFTSNEPVSWAIDGGQDLNRFAIDASTGALSFLVAPDYENPLDYPDGGASNNIYGVSVKATDGANNVTSQFVSVTVANVADTTVDSISDNSTSPSPAASPAPSIPLPAPSPEPPASIPQPSSLLGVSPGPRVALVVLETPLLLGTLAYTQAYVGTEARDRITGQGGNDVISGGTGRDRLTGGGGADAFYLKRRMALAPAGPTW